MRVSKYIILFVFCLQFAKGQDLSLSGRILDGEDPLASVSVQLVNEQNTYGTYSLADGSFSLDQIQQGDYLLTVKFIGFRSYNDTVAVRSANISLADISLEEDVLGLEEVVVSATRYGTGRKESPVIVSLTGKKQFQATNAQAISEVLNFQPGVRVETNCQNCGFTQVRLNGLEGAYSQILINSRAVFSALNSVYGLDQIPTSIVDRIEVVRSGGSALYGSNAIAGTINIITKDPLVNQWELKTNLNVLDGGGPEWITNGNASLLSKDLSKGITLYGMLRDRSSFDANEDSFTEITELSNRTAGMRAYIRPDFYSKITLDVNYVYEYRRGGDRLSLSPEFTDITEELTHNTLFSGLTYERTSKDKRTDFSAYFSTQYTNRDSYYGGLGGGRTAEDSLLASQAFGTTTDFALVGGVQLAHAFNEKAKLIGGVENQYSDVEDQILGYERIVDQQVNTLGIFSQLEWSPMDKVKTLIGGRFDYSSVSGRYTVRDIERNIDLDVPVFSPRFTLMVDLTEDIQFRGGYARGFRAPQAFNEDLHISSVGGEPQFVILSEELEKETSDAFTASFAYENTLGNTQLFALVEGFYTSLQNPFSIVSTGSTLPNGSIVEEVRNGESASVSGINLEFNVAPSPSFYIQSGATIQQTAYSNPQLLFEPEDGNDTEPAISVDEFTRTPNFYGYLTTNWKPVKSFSLDLTTAYTGSMIVPRVVSETGFLDLVDSRDFLELNLKATQQLSISEKLQLELSAGVQNILNAYQDDFELGPTRDSDYVYGPARPRTFFVSVKVGRF
ncbi:MAG: TonB-dependent receptor [Bacteroidota bacterium]